MYYDSNDSCPLFFVSLKVDNILYIILRLKRTNIPMQHIYITDYQ